MDIGKITDKIPKWLREYRYPILIALLGVILLTVPKLQKEQSSETTATSPQIQQVDVADLLTQILGQIEGVGKVKVLLTVSAGETTIYHQDEDISTGDSTSTVRKETVIVTDSNRNQQPLISQIISATYQGAVIVCQGAEDPSIKLAVVDAVSKATGLGANQISVLKMK